MRMIGHKVYWSLLLSIFVVNHLAAADAMIRGVVTDDAGKPVRGALIKASTPERSFSRFTQNDGKYEISLPSGNYTVTVDAYGFAAKRQTVNTDQTGRTDFTVAPKWDITRLLGSEMEGLVTNDAQGNLVKDSCIDCHDLSVVIQRRGTVAADWVGFLHEMPRGKRPDLPFSPLKFDALGVALEKYFGPSAPYFGPDADAPSREQIKHAPIADPVLKATIREWTIHTGASSDRPESFPHSIMVDPLNAQTMWFSEIGYRANKIARLDLETDKIIEYPVPTPKSSPHSGIVGKDGRVWMTVATPGISAKLLSLDPRTGQVKEYAYPGKRIGAHSLALDKAGNLWISVTGPVNEVWFFDVSKEQFRSFSYPVPDKYPANSKGSWGEVPGDSEATRLGLYHVAVDSRGMIWGGTMQTGMIVRIDPATGATKEYQPANVACIRGIDVDGQDNIWFGAFFDHKLGMLDSKTGTVKLYQPPTSGATPYGVVVDKRTGYIWISDFSGNHITRFDPKTEQFIEYPIPSRSAYPRFIDLDQQGRPWFTEYWNGKIGFLDPGVDSQQKASR